MVDKIMQAGGASLAVGGSVLGFAYSFDAGAVAGAITTIGAAVIGLMMFGIGALRSAWVSSLKDYDEAYKETNISKLEHAEKEIGTLRVEIEELKEKVAEERRLRKEEYDKQMQVVVALTKGLAKISSPKPGEKG